MAVKLDLIGSTLQVGYTDFRQSHGVRRAYVDGLQSDLHSTAVAIQDIRDEIGNVHPSMSNLPLGAIRAVKIGPDKALAQITYRHNQYNFPLPSTPATVLVRTRGTYKATPVWRAFTNEQGQFTVSPSGMPLGQMHGVADPTDVFGQPFAETWDRPVFEIYIPTVLSFDPLESVAGALGKTNSEPVLFGGVTFGVNTIRFDRLLTDWTFDPSITIFSSQPIGASLGGSGGQSVGGGIRIVYRVEYIFTAIAGGFATQKLISPGQTNPDTGQPSTTWDTFEEPAHESVDFIGAFPFHI